MNRTVKLGAVSVAAAVATIVLLVLFWMLVDGIGSGPQSAAESFFAGIASKGAQAAYATTSPAFQRATPVDAFVATAQASRLGDYQSSSWTKTNDAGGDRAGVADLSGVINLKGGGAIPAKLGLVKGESGWSVLSLNLPVGGLSGAQAPPTPVSPTEPQGSDASAMAQPGVAQPGVAQSGMVQPGAAQSTTAQPNPDAAPQQTPPAGLAGNDMSPQSPAPATSRNSPMVVTSRSVAGICGRDILRHGRVETLDVHCSSGLAAAPGSAAQCTAVINGRRQGVEAMLQHYDAVSGRADVSCHPQG